MKLARVPAALALLITGSVTLLISGAALALSPFRLGRLLRAVSVPHLRQHRLRTFLTVLGIALGVALLVAVMMVNQSVLRGVQETIEDISGKAELEVSAGSSGFDDTLAERVRAVPGVARVGVLLQQITTVVHEKTGGERAIVIGTDLLSEDDAYFRAYASNSLDEIKKDPLPFLNGTHNILLGRALLDALHTGVGKQIALSTGTGIQNFTVHGVLEPEGIGGAFDGAILVMDYQAMQEAFSRGRNLDRLDIALAPGATLADVRTRLRTLLGDGFVVDAPERKGARMSSMLLGVRTALSMASVIALLVGGFLIYNSLTISIVQRKREIGTLRALGAERSDMRVLLTLEGSLLGVVGSALGLLFGLAMARSLLDATNGVLNATYFQLSASRVQLDFGILLAGACLGVVAATFAAALAAGRAAALRPVQTLRDVGAVSAARSASKLRLADVCAPLVVLLIWGVLKLPAYEGVPLPAFAASGLVLLVGVLLLPRLLQAQQALVHAARRVLFLEARLANKNLSRDLGRTTTTSSALMVGVAMVTAFASFSTSFVSAIERWMEQTMPGELFVTHGASVPGASSRNVPIADVLREGLLALPEVSEVRRVHVTEVPYGGVSIKLVSSDIEVYARHARIRALEGTSEGALAGMQRGEVAVSENFSRRFHVHAGDTIALGDGHGTRRFGVCAVVVDYTSDLGTILISREAFVAAYSDARVSTYEVHLREGARALDVRRAIYAGLGKTHDLFVLTNGEVRAEVLDRTQQVFSLLRMLELVALIVAVLGVVNALFASVLDRVREIGVLRALGMTRFSVSKLVMIEGLSIGVLGLVAGVLSGFGLGYVMLEHINLASTGWHFPFEVSLTSLLEVGVLTLVTTALASYFPARATARLVVTEALGYE